ncbi:hypothetical protein [Moraxella lacunata]|uniref:hypothetical protein n=1 Tax=Moraxella lacunata TaxID=477 RepID=UPI003EDF30D5
MCGYMALAKSKSEGLPHLKQKPPKGGFCDIRTVMSYSLCFLTCSIRLSVSGCVDSTDQCP